MWAKFPNSSLLTKQFNEIMQAAPIIWYFSFSYYNSVVIVWDYLLLGVWSRPVFWECCIIVGLIQHQFVFHYAGGATISTTTVFSTTSSTERSNLTWTGRWAQRREQLTRCSVANEWEWGQSGENKLNTDWVVWEITKFPNCSVDEYRFVFVVCRHAHFFHL